MHLMHWIKPFQRTSEGGHELPLMVYTFFWWPASPICLVLLVPHWVHLAQWLDRMAYVPGGGSSKLSARGSAFSDFRV